MIFAVLPFGFSLIFAVLPFGWSLLEFLKWVIIIAAAVAIVVIALRAFKVAIPDWAVQIFWVVVVAIVAILAITIVASL